MTDEEVRLDVRDLRIVQTETEADVVDEVSFTVRTRCTLGLVGESGSGKTTAALALLGYARRGLRIDSGRVIVEGQNVLGMPPGAVRELRGSRVAYVPQDPSSALHPALKVGAQLREVLEKHDKAGDHAAREARLVEVLDEVRLGRNEVLDTYPHQLSGGQQQRIVLAMAFVLRPAVIVLDEPTTGLDVSTQRHVLETIRVLCQTHGVAGLFVSHDLAVISDLVDEVAVMYAGRIVEIGPKDQVFGTPAHPYTRALLRAAPSASRSQLLVGLGGHPPRPGHRPTGCSFAPRCQFVQPACKMVPPPLAQIARDRHSVRCIRADELPPYTQLPSSRSKTGFGSATSGAARLLSISDLCASYGKVPVLHGLSWAVSEGECLAVVGESGSGKTTMARCVVGLHQRWSGNVMLEGELLPPGIRGRQLQTLRTMQYIFQNPYGSLNPRKRVHEILEQPLTRFFDLDARERSRRIGAALEDAALDVELRRRTPGELSGGERQRVAIARALVAQPRILVCDEITASLDVSVQAAVIEVLRRLQDERGLALLFITHNLALVRSIAQHVVVMQHGEIVEQGTAESVLTRPEAEYTRRLLTDVPHAYGDARRAADLPGLQRASPSSTAAGARADDR